jgi:Fe-S cluster assembly protein SufD
MAIESFLKVDSQDPDWSNSPTQYFGKKFKVIDANCLMIKENTDDLMVLRMNPTESDLLCKNLQVLGKDSSRLDLFILCDGSKNTQQVFIYNVTAEPDSIINIGIFVKDGKLNKHIFECELYENSVINIFGLAENEVGGSSEIISKVYHAGPCAESNTFVNSIAGKNSRTVFQGIVKIEEDMLDSVASVTNTSITCDETAQAFSTPQMIIDCGQVRAYHNCEVNTVDENNLWYLESRGIDRSSAETLLKTLHQDSVLDLIEYQDIRDELKDFFQS